MPVNVIAVTKIAKHPLTYQENGLNFAWACGFDVGGLWL